MPPLGWENLNAIFHEALALDSAERAAYLERICGDDPDLRAAVEALLRSHEETNNILDKTALQAAADGQLKAGNIMQHYRIVSLLGSGGMGSVYLAEDLKLHRRVSLKLLPLAATRDQERLQRFKQEARASSALNHPNVLTIYEISEDDDRHFIATEFIDGNTLRERMASPIAIEEVIRIGIDVASALVATHRVHIVHRDIKPENIMIRRDDGLVKVLDFGLAKISSPHIIPAGNILESPTIPRVDTAPGVVMGTVHYMSPEQARGESIDERSDIWSLGVVLFEMIAGCRPFMGGTMTEIIAAILSEPALPLSRYSPSVPKRLQDIVEKCLAKNRDERYQTSDNLLLDLKQLQQSLGSASVQAKPVSGFAKNDNGKSNRYRYAIIIAALFLSLSVVVIYFWRDKLGLSRASRSIGSIAVLPLSFSDSDPDTEFLSDGITENIIGRLSQLPNLKVMAHSAVTHYKGNKEDTRTIARDLSVEVILTGRLARRADIVTINIELVNPLDNSRIWGEQYERKISDLPTIQKEIPIDVSNKLRLRLSGKSKERLARTDTRDSEAYQLYLKGRLSWERWSQNGSRQAIAFFDEAIKIDPGYALAWSGKADAYLVGPGVGPDVPWKEVQRLAKEAAEKALQLDPDLGEAHVALASVLIHANRDFEGAERKYKEGLMLNPNFAEGHHLYSHLLAAQGRIDEAFAESRKFLDLDPISRTPYEHLALNQTQAGQYDEAINTYREVLRKFPNEEAENYFLLGDVYSEKQMHREALKSYLDAFVRVSYSPQAISKFNDAFDRTGIKGFYRAVLEHFKAMPKSAVHFSIAELHARLGEKDEAIKLIEKDLGEGSSQFLFINEIPGFNSLKSDERYRQLLRGVGIHY